MVSLVPPRRQLFELGNVVITPGAYELLEQQEVRPIDLLKRHITGSWGIVSEDDAKANDDALVQGGRILSVYALGDKPRRSNPRVWVITEARGDDGQRACTTILLPDEY